MDLKGETWGFLGFTILMSENTRVLIMSFRRNERIKQLAFNGEQHTVLFSPTFKKIEPETSCLNIFWILESKNN